MNNYSKGKSSPQQLENRGYADNSQEDFFLNKSLNELVHSLESKSAVERTLSARILGKRKEFDAVEKLCTALETENKLYTKIEICKALVNFHKAAIPGLISRLGTIGNNQHKKPQEEVFRKDSYPLPRDICARTLIRIGKDTLPDLMFVLKSDPVKSVSEAIDAIGYICFYNHSPVVYSELRLCFERFLDNELIQWKILRAMSAFCESEEFLNDQLECIKNNKISMEIGRSLRLLSRRRS